MHALSRLMDIWWLPTLVGEHDLCQILTAQGHDEEEQELVQSHLASVVLPAASALR